MDENLIDRGIHEKNKLRSELEIQIIRQKRDLEKSQLLLVEVEKDLYELQFQKSNRIFP